MLSEKNISFCEGSICVNTEGNYTCENPEDFSEDNPCPVGFQEQGGKCEDINECQTGQHDCLEGQRCDNTLGSFLCVRFTTCGTGYTLNYGQTAHSTPTLSQLIIIFRLRELRGQ